MGTNRTTDRPFVLGRDDDLTSGEGGGHCVGAPIKQNEDKFDMFDRDVERSQL